MIRSAGRCTGAATTRPCDVADAGPRVGAAASAPHSQATASARVSPGHIIDALCERLVLRCARIEEAGHARRVAARHDERGAVPGRASRTADAGAAARD